MTHRAPQPQEGERGFTLIEVIAGLAVASLILVSLNLVMGTINRGFDQTARTLSRQNAMSGALDIFGSDVARIETIRGRGADGEPQPFLFSGREREVIYVLAERPGNNPAGLYLVRLYVRDSDGDAELIRARAALPAGSFDMAEAGWQDEVMLLSGPYDISFSYRAPRQGLRSWGSGWESGAKMPEQIRLTITDRATGRLRVPGLVQSLKINGEAACLRPEAKDCGKTPAQEAPQ